MSERGLRELKEIRRLLAAILAELKEIRTQLLLNM